MKQKGMLAFFNRFVFLILVGFFLGVWSAPSLREWPSYFSARISLGKPGEELAGYRKNINDLRIQIINIEGFCRIRQNELSRQEKILAEAAKKLASASTDVKITVGPGAYSTAEVKQDISQREQQCEILRQDISDDQKLIGEFNHRLGQLTEVADLLEKELIGQGQNKEVKKATLAAFLNDGQIAEQVPNYFFLAYDYRLKKAQDAHSRICQAAQTKQEIELAETKAFSWLAPVIPDLYWLEPFIKQEKANQILASAIEVLKNRDYQAALNYLNQALEFDAESVEVKKYIGLTSMNISIGLWQENSFNDALSNLNRLLVGDPDNVTILTKKGVCLAFLNDSGQALAVIEQALSKDSDYPEALLNKANVLIYRNKSHVQYETSGCEKKSYLVRDDWNMAAKIFNQLIADSKDQQIIQLAIKGRDLLKENLAETKVKVEFIMMDHQGRCHLKPLKVVYQ